MPIYGYCTVLILTFGLTDPEAIQHDNLKIAYQFVQAIRNASLDSFPLECGTIKCLCHCSKTPSDLSDHCLRLSLQMLLNHGNAAQDAYDKNIQAVRTTSVGESSSKGLHQDAQSNSK